MRHFPTTLLAIAVACSAPDAQPSTIASPQPRSTPNVVRVDTIARGLVHPWAVAQLPDGRYLVTERGGTMRIVAANGTVGAPLAGVPAVQGFGQGGLLDVILDRNFANNRTIYFSFSEPDDDRRAGTSVARAILSDDGLTDVRVIWRQEPKVRGAGHFGSRLVIAHDGNLFITTGDRQSYRDRAQDLRSGLGKVHRITTTGDVPPDNPFARRSDAQPTIWSYGHRNLQGAALHPQTGELWTVEHGARGGDELNRPQAGRNYGWPVITYGVDYGGGRIGEGTHHSGMEQPIYYWDPVIAPSGMTFYTGTLFPGWRGSILIGSMSPGGLVRLEMQDGRVVREERYLGELRSRIRDVRQAPDGSILLLTDSPDGVLLRGRPAPR